MKKREKEGCSSSGGRKRNRDASRRILRVTGRVNIDRLDRPICQEMTYRRTQRACRFADRGEKKFTRRIPRLARTDLLGKIALLVLRAVFRACHDASIGCRPSTVTEETKANARARLSPRNRRLLVPSRCSTTYHAHFQRRAAFQFDGNAIADGIKIVVQGESIKGFADPSVTRLCPPFLQKSDPWILVDRVSRLVHVLSDHPVAHRSREQTEFLFHRGSEVVVRFSLSLSLPLSAERGKKVTNAVGAH